MTTIHPASLRSLWLQPPFGHANQNVCSQGRKTIRRILQAGQLPIAAVPLWWVMLIPIFIITYNRLAVLREMLASLERRGGAAEMSREIWRQASAFRVRREAPRLTSRGKMMPLQVSRRGSAAAV